MMGTKSLIRRLVNPKRSIIAFIQKWPGKGKPQLGFIFSIFVIMVGFQNCAPVRLTAADQKIPADLGEPPTGGDPIDTESKLNSSFAATISLHCSIDPVQIRAFNCEPGYNGSVSDRHWSIVDGNGVSLTDRSNFCDNYEMGGCYATNLNPGTYTIKVSGIDTYNSNRIESNSVSLTIASSPISSGGGTTTTNLPTALNCSRSGILSAYVPTNNPTNTLTIESATYGGGLCFPNKTLDPSLIIQYRIPTNEDFAMSLINHSFDGTIDYMAVMNCQTNPTERIHRYFL